MRNLIDGLQKFQNDDFRQLSDLFQELAKGQKPETLFITCSDSRIDPNRLTHTQPGELFVLRNAGNIVPPHGTGPTGEAATIEFAVAGLGVKNIVVCGHSQCGAIKALLKPEMLAELPAMQGWLSHCEAARRIVRENYKDLQGNDLLWVAIQENVLAQLEHVKTLPAVAARLARGEVQLHGWVYEFETGNVFGYEPRHQQFNPIGRMLTSANKSSLLQRKATV
jgi:carbonic anhydrase